MHLFTLPLFCCCQLFFPFFFTDPLWHGPFAAIPSIGYEILKNVPNGSPTIIQGTPLPQDAFDQVPLTYPWLKSGVNSCRWWDTFYTDQFHWIPATHQPLPVNVWAVVVPDRRPNVPPVVEGIRVRPDEVPVLEIRDRVPDSLDELHIGDVVAVRPPLNFVPEVEDADFPPEQYWIAVIKAINPGDAEPIVLNYYCQSHTNDRRYRLDPRGSSGSCALTAVLAYGFDFTTTGLLRAVTVRSLERILDF